MDLWVCGKIWSGDANLGIFLDDEDDLFPWTMVGIYSDRGKAKEACTSDDHFLFRMDLDTPLKGLVEVDYPVRDQKRHS